MNVEELQAIIFTTYKGMPQMLDGLVHYDTLARLVEEKLKEADTPTEPCDFYPVLDSMIEQIVERETGKWVTISST